MYFNKLAVFNIFIAGIIIGLFSCVLTVSFYKVSYETKVHNLKALASMCAGVGSTPQSFNLHSVQCTNGAELKYD